MICLLQRDLADRIKKQYAKLLMIWLKMIHGMSHFMIWLRMIHGMNEPFKSLPDHAFGDIGADWERT